MSWLLGILAVWALWGATWLALGLWANRTDLAASRGQQAPYRIINIIAFAGLFADGYFRKDATGIHWRPFLPPLWHVPPAIGLLAVLLAAGGFGLAVWSRVTLGRLWSAAVTRKEGHDLVDRGPYALIRHPIYTALFMGGAALAIAKGTPIVLAGFALMLIGYTIKARLEERFLAVQLGAETYATYRRRVPMLVPFAPPARN